MQKTFHSLFSTLPLAAIGCLIPLSAQAQITPDGTTSTTVNREGNNFAIEQGDRIGDNLFHSFDEFSLPTQGSAVFNNAGDIANIFSRVTGSSISNIDGLLGANGIANLYLINPNGIIFGENASLNLGGSFFASTADSLLFEGNTEFSAVDPQAPSLLEVSIPIGARFRDNPGDIVNLSFTVNDAGDENVGLEVLSGQSLTLLGGNINFEAGEATASGGNIYLGGLVEAGIVNLNENGSLSIPEELVKADVILTNAADIDVKGINAGNINIDAQSLSLMAGKFGSSLIQAGITADSTSTEAQAGNITLNVSENITLDNSFIKNRVFPKAIGNAGNINIASDSLSITNGGEISANTLGQGDGGQINIITTDNIKIDAGNLDSPSQIASIVFPKAIGNAGNINIASDSLSITNGGGIGTFTLGKGNAGQINITADNFLILDGINPFEDRIESSITSSVGRQGEGNAGNITIDTGSLSLTNGALVNVGIFGTGKDGEKAVGGEITIDAAQSVFIDSSDDSLPRSAISTEIGQNALGNGGNIEINTSNLLLTNNGQIIGSTFGTGDSGNITINATKSIILEDGNIFNRVENNGKGIGGEIKISTANLSVIDGGQITVSTLGKGNSGSIKIDATESVTIQGRSRSSLIDDDINRGVRSRISSTVQNGAKGQGGNIRITTTSLSINNDGTVIAGTLGHGNAGNIIINASELVSVDGSNAVEAGLNSSGILNTSEENAVGNAGGIDISTTNFSLINTGQIDVSSFGDGNGGDISIQADTATLNNGIISATNTPAQPVSDEVIRTGGNVNFTISEDIVLRNNSQVSARASENANGGNVTINAKDGFILAFPNQNNDIIANASEGRGGVIDIDTQAIFGLEVRPDDPITNDIDASSGVDGLDGTVDINNPTVDPTTGLINLPASVGNASDQISQNPCQQGVGSQFVVAGKGGLPPGVNESVNSESARVGLIEPIEARRGNEETRRLEEGESGRQENIDRANIPAQGWVFNDKGEVTLTAYQTTDTEVGRSFQKVPDSCSVSSFQNR